MFLYELAIELGQRSTDLIELAEGVGMVGLGPSSRLDAAQVAALRAQLGGGSAALAPPPPIGAPTSPVPGSAPEGMPTFLAPPVPGPTPSGAPMGPGWPGAPSSGPGQLDGGGIGRGQVVAIAMVVVLVAGLFGFMALHTGPDAARRDAIAAADETATTVTFVPPTTTTEPTTSTVPPATTIPPSVPRNPADFCVGARKIAAFELRSVADMLDQDFGAAKARLGAARPNWGSGVSIMRVTAPPNLDAALAEYQTLYEHFFDAYAASTSMDDLRSNLDVAGIQRGAGSGAAIDRAIRANC